MNVTPFSRKSGGAVISHMDITDRKAQEEKTQRLADYDELTGVANRRRFYEVAQGVLGQAERSRLPFSLLYLDLNDFKGINDRHGHACGDALLKHVSARLHGLTRDGDLLARFGGDEFVVLFHGVSRSDAEGVAERYRAALQGPFVLEGHQLRGVGSLGAASYPEEGTTVDELLRHADALMYQEKARRRALVPSREAEPEELRLPA